MKAGRIESRVFFLVSLLVLAAVLRLPLMVATGAPSDQGGPMSLAEQRRAAEKAGFTVVPSPDAPQQGDAPRAFCDEVQKSKAAVFIRDYNLPIYPEGRLHAKELAAPAVVTAARGESEPLSLGVQALADLQDLSVSVGPLTTADGVTLPAEAVRVRYLEAAYIRSAGQRAKTAVLTGLRVRPLTPLPLPRGMNRQFWLDVSVPESAAAGGYMGEIVVTSKGRPAVKRTLTVRVRPYELEEPTDRFIGAFCANAIVPDRQTFADWKDHGVTGMLWFWSSLPWEMKVDRGKLVCDFSKTEKVIDDRVAAGLTGPVVIALGNDRSGFYEQALCRLYDRPLADKSSRGGRTARVARLDDEVINRAYKEGIGQLSALVKTKAHWPEVVLLHYDEPTERLMAEATLRYTQIKEVAPELRVYGVTMNRLSWAKMLAPISDILVCNGDYAEISALGQETGKEVWGYSGAQAVTGFGGSRFNMGLRLYRYKLGGHWFWCYDYYVGDPWNEFDGFTGDANWVVAYPGTTRGRHIPTLAWEGIREAYDDLRYAATLEKLLAKRQGTVRDRIATDYEQFLADLARDPDLGAFPPDPDGSHSTLPSYHKLSDLRTRLAAWIEQLAPAPSTFVPKGTPR